MIQSARIRAVTVRPLSAGTLRLEEVDSPERLPGELLIRAHALGICGTDHEIIEGLYGAAPPESNGRLILGHESLGIVEEAPEGGDFAPGDAVVGMVRWPDPVPCANCAVGEWDMCRNGKYTEHGIAGRDGFAIERYALPPDRVVRVDPSLGELGVLLEPTSVVAKAWQHIDHFAARSTAPLESVLVTGAGPVGLLAALLGRQRGLEVHVLDRVEQGVKPDLVRDLGATYHAAGPENLEIEPDVVIECTGAVPLILDALKRTGRNGIVCLAGISPAGRRIEVDLGAIDRELVLENDVVFGSVNANRRHYEAAAAALAQADRAWLERLITRRVPLERWQEAFERRDDDVKTILVFDA